MHPGMPSTLAESRSEEGGSRTQGSFKDALLAEIKRSKAVFYNMVVVQAQKIEVAEDRVSFTFSPTQRTLSSALEQPGLKRPLRHPELALRRDQAVENRRDQSGRCSLSA